VPAIKKYGEPAVRRALNRRFKSRLLKQMREAEEKLRDVERTLKA
jgi:hypothetical protein